jgi:peroxiredoxin/uncharacterized membrane protein YphA (DoxX/SURF4 family)
MEGIALAARLLLAIVFAAAAVGKLHDQPGGRRALAGFGIPERSVAPVAVLLPLAELATAVALVPRSSARWGAIAALFLLLLFVAGIARAMSRGEAPDCHCFGHLGSAPAGRRTLIRNAVLALLAVLLAAYGPGEGIDGWVSGRSAAELAAAGAGVCAAALAALLVRLWLENRRLRRDLMGAREATALLPPGLPVGAQAPKFSLPGADGARISLDTLLARGRPVALVFVSPSCAPCTGMLPDLARWQSTLAERITIALLSTGTLRENWLVRERHGLENMLVQGGNEVSEAYRVAATPSVVIVTRDGRIGSRTRSSRPIAEAVIRSALHSEPLLPLGSVAANGDG